MLFVQVFFFNKFRTQLYYAQVCIITRNCVNLASKFDARKTKSLVQIHCISFFVRDIRPTWKFSTALITLLAVYLCLKSEPAT